MTDPSLTASVAIVDRAHDLAGSVFCPRCGCRLGRAESPALCYLKRCGGCDRAIALELRGGKLFIGIEDTAPVSH